MNFALSICTHFVFYDQSNSVEYLQRYSPSKVDIINFFRIFDIKPDLCEQNFFLDER